MSDQEVVTVKKAGEPTLKISRAALVQHVKLGWQHVETIPEAIVEAVTGKTVEEQDAAKADKDSKVLSLKK